MDLVYVAALLGGGLGGGWWLATHPRPKGQGVVVTHVLPARHQQQQPGGRP